VQVFARELATANGHDVDQPRNPAEVGAALSGRGWDGRLRRCGRACQLPD